MDADVEEAKTGDDGAIKIVAVLKGKIIGIGEVVPAARELNACYVSPLSSGTGVGKAIVAELETIARAHGAPFLALASSLTAQPFYSALGYEVLEHGEHVLRSGGRMACVRMRKEL
jgi:putative acetyltransferase